MATPIRRGRNQWTGGKAALALVVHWNVATRTLERWLTALSQEALPTNGTIRLGYPVSPNCLATVTGNTQTWATDKAGHLLAAAIEPDLLRQLIAAACQLTQGAEPPPANQSHKEVLRILTCPG